MARLTVKVVPGSSRDQIVGWLGDALKVKVTAPPEKGRANAAVVAILADRLFHDRTHAILVELSRVIVGAAAVDVMHPCNSGQILAEVWIHD